MSKNDKLNLPENDRILIDKPENMTSFGVVARVRRVLSKEFGKKVKVGHTGTLDPFATGLLVLVYGKETKNAMSLMKLDKVYEAEIALGETSSTGDPEGEISKNEDFEIPNEGEVLNAISKFTGKIMQIPPAFSAIKIDGKRAYNLARKGEKVEIPPREVEIYSLDLIEYNFPKLKIRVHVSSGTYIRTLAEDIGRELKTGAYCSQLRRIKIADYDVKSAKTLADFGIVD